MLAAVENMGGERNPGREAHVRALPAYIEPASLSAAGSDVADSRSDQRKRRWVASPGPKRELQFDESG